ncbi:MAG: general stress protein [Candidatus Levybacteria bacterium]|nr:general stress protein [Candidatus Levybacteria bacterium]
MAQKTILGVFSESDDAESAINSLSSEGYDVKDISILMKDKEKSSSLGRNTGAKVVGGTLSGATAGVVLGGLTGLLASYIIPGVGAFFIGGPIASALGLTGAAATTASGAVTGGVAGGIVGALTGLGLSNEQARVYEERINEGAILLAVPVRMGEEARAEEILVDNDADDVQLIDVGMQREYGFSEEGSSSSQSPYAFVGTKGGKSGKNKSNKGRLSSKSKKR